MVMLWYSGFLALYVSGCEKCLLVAGVGLGDEGVDEVGGVWV